jgi:hypothetical protein
MHRLVEANALPYHHWLIADLGMKNVYAPLNSKHLERLSIISRTPGAQLATHQSSSRKAVPLGHRVPPSMIERCASRICLPCFRMSTYHRLSWDFTPVAVCHIHGCRLIGACPTCGSRLDWRRNVLAKCPNNHSLLDPRLDRKLTFVAPGELGGTRAVQDCLSGDRDGAYLSKVVLNADLSLTDLVEMLEMLGSLGEAKISQPSRDQKLRYQADNFHQILNRGYSIACTWPSGLYGALDNLAASLGNPIFLTDGRDDRRILLHRYLCARSGRPYAKLIAQALWDHAAKRGVGLSPGAFGYTPDGFHERFVGASKARDILKVDYAKLVKIAQKEKWFGVAQLATTGKKTWLERSDVEGWMSRNPTAFTPSALVKRLHVIRETVHAMNERALFGLDAKKRATSAAPWQLLENELRAFADNLKSLPIAGRKKDPGYVSWNQFRKLSHLKTICFADVLEGVMKCEIRVSRIEADNLPRLRFNLLDALSFVRKQASDEFAPTATITVPLSLGAVVRRYHIGWYQLQRAISLGLLKVEERHFIATKSWVTHQTLEEFFDDYTTPGLLARKHNKIAGSLAWALLRLRVKQCSPDRGLHPNNPIYAWRDIHAVGLSRILAQAKDRKRAPAPRAMKPLAECAKLRAHP